MDRALDDDRVIFVSKGAPGRGLIVDDDYFVCEILADTLTEFGIGVSCACDGESALTLLTVAPTPFHFAIIDLRLPGRLTGAGLARMIRASGMAVVLMSADHDLLDAAQRDDANAVCLSKPFRSGTLLDCVARTVIEAG